MLGRVDSVVASSQHGDGAGGEARAVGGGVDAARQAGDDAKTDLTQFTRQPFRELDPGGGRVARADHGD